MFSNTLHVILKFQLAVDTLLVTILNWIVAIYFLEWLEHIGVDQLLQSVTLPAFFLFFSHLIVT